MVGLPLGREQARETNGNVSLTRKCLCLRKESRNVVTGRRGWKGLVDVALLAL
jgi:hypothetical protein